MSAFDDEFGLFGDDEAPADDADRKPTLGARKIASSDSGGDDVEFDEERPRRGRRDATGGGDGATGERRPWRDRGPAGDRGPRKTDPEQAQARATDLLDFLARGLVTKPDEVIVEKIETSRGPVIELEVHPEDLGKVIGRGGRVAQALRTLVRASAEGRIGVDIVDVEDDETFEDDLEHRPPKDATDDAE